MNNFVRALETIEVVKISAFMKEKGFERKPGSTKLQCIWIIEEKAYSSRIWFEYHLCSFVLKKTSLIESDKLEIGVVELLQLAEDSKDAQNEVGDRYRIGRDGFERNKQMAMDWYLRAAEKGDAMAQYKLALCYEGEDETQTNTENALSWFLKAAQQGVVDAQYKLSWYYRYKKGIQPNLEQAMYWNLQAAENGHVYAQFNLFLYYNKGDGTEKNLELSTYWLRKAAELDEPDAQYRLGWGYRNGSSLEKNYEMAVDWLQKAARQGHPNAQYSLALCYGEGNGVKPDLSLSVYWYQASAEQGHISSQYNLAMCYWNGEGIKKNIDLALHWIGKAAELGDTDAQYCLGYWYEKGCEVEKDYKKAIHWFEKANTNESHYALGELFMKTPRGSGKLDYKQAYDHFHLAASADIKEAKDALLLFRGEILSSLLAQEWPMTHSRLHPHCREAVKEVVYVSRECFGMEFFVPKEILREFIFYLIQLWPKQEEHDPYCG